MKRHLPLLLLLCLSFQIRAQVSALLAITPRLQWPNADGYCGENSIQMCGLYYGNYISQGLCRTVAGGELLIYVNDTTALASFSMNFNEWDPNGSTPQYKTYLDWVKQYLNKKQPVIITVYINGLNDPDYDHIIPAIGFSATSVNTYTGTDQLTYISNFDTTAFVRAFSTLYDTRSMSGNGATYSYCIPEDVDYGVAVTGNYDPQHLTKPVHIVLDSIDEPNVSLGVPARLMKAKLTADSLTPGATYVMLRYNNYQTVPSTGFSPANANAAVYFTAAGTSVTLKDSFMSNTAVFYRCIPHTITGIEEQTIADDGSFLVFPNPSGGTFRVLIPEHTQTLDISDVAGRMIRHIAINGEEQLDLMMEEKGVYFIRVFGEKTANVRKLIVR